MGLGPTGLHCLVGQYGEVCTSVVPEDDACRVEPGDQIMVDGLDMAGRGLLQIC